MMQPFFKPVFGQHWDDLPPVFQSHYATRIDKLTRHRAQGHMSLYPSAIIRLLKPILSLLNNLPAQAGDNLPVTVGFITDKDRQGVCFDRHFSYQGQDYPYRFKTTMIHAPHSPQQKPILGSENSHDLVEIMDYGFCWLSRMHYDPAQRQVILNHRGYAIRIFGRIIPLPLNWLLGRISSHETAIDEYHFAMQMTLHHPLFGILYRYEGQFSMASPVTAAKEPHDD